MNRRGFMQTPFGAVATALLPLSWRTKKNDGLYIYRDCSNGKWWPYKYFEIKLVSNGKPIACDVTTTADGEGICYTITND